MIINEFVGTNDIYPDTHTHHGVLKQLRVKSKMSGFNPKQVMGLFAVFRPEDPKNSH